MLSKTLILIFSLALQAGAQNSGGKPIAFEDLDRLVREKNENVKAAEKSHLAERERKGYLGRSFLPKVSARAGDESYKVGSRSRERQGYWMLEGKLNIYHGGRDKIEGEIRDTNERIAKSELAGEYNRELVKARQTYWKLVGVGILIKDRQEALEKNEGHLSSSRRRRGAGLATNADTLQFELHKTLLRQELKKLVLEQDLLRNRLAVALGWPEHESLRVVDAFPHPKDHGAKIEDLVPNSNITLKIASERERRQRVRARQDGRWWLPQIDLYSSYGLPSIGDEYARAKAHQPEWIAGVQVGINLAEGLDQRREAKAKSLEAEAEKNRADYSLRQIVAADHELRHDLKLLHELIHDSDNDNAKAEDFLKITRSEYTRGVRNGPDLLEAFKNLYEFRQRRTALYQEYHETHAELMGLLATDQ